ncbi:MAG: outer membrane lipoprotein-sorting protein [Candidatus Hydrogenedentota bacterium]
MKRAVQILSFGVVLAWGITSTPAFAGEELSVDEIVDKANHMAYYQGEDGRARVKMTITDDQGRKRQKELTILRKNMDDKDEEQRFYVYFHEPPDERGTVFMVWKHVGKDDDRWLYLPALDVIKRIAASDERTSFVGSDFYYEDVSGRNPEEDNHELVKTDDTYYVVKSTPKPENKDKVEFDSYTSYIHKATFIPVSIQYEQDGKVYRENKVLSVKDIQGFKTVVKNSMKDHNRGSETVLDYTAVKYNTGLPDDIFTERYLRKPPREYLK